LEARPKPPALYIFQIVEYIKYHEIEIYHTVIIRKQQSNYMHMVTDSLSEFKCVEMVKVR
jgi:hypothetical protein